MTACPYCLAQTCRQHYAGRTGTILECQACGGLFSSDRQGELLPDDHSIHDASTQEYLNTYSDNHSAEVTIARSMLGSLAEQGVSQGRVLEFGCGNAMIGQVAAREAKQLQWIGVELSAELYGALAAEIKPQVIHAADYQSALAKVEDGSCQAVIMHHVLEHLPEPRVILEALSKKLAPGGVLLIEVPNEQWKRPLILLRRLLKPSGDDWFPGHINFFTQSHLLAFLNRLGFKVTWHRKLTAGEYPALVTKMMGGEEVLAKAPLARLVLFILSISRIEKLLTYGISLRVACRPAAP